MATYRVWHTSWSGLTDRSLGSGRTAYMVEWTHMGMKGAVSVRSAPRVSHSFLCGIGRISRLPLSMVGEVLITTVVSPQNLSPRLRWPGSQQRWTKLLNVFVQKLLYEGGRGIGTWRKLTRVRRAPWYWMMRILLVITWCIGWSVADRGSLADVTLV